MITEMTLTLPEVMTLPSDQDATGRTLGDEELEMLRQVIASGTLTSTKGDFTRRFENRFARLFGVKHAFACASGTAALHCAIAALDLEPGDEIITTSITDMGALTPILYQGAIPVFADVDPRTCNITARAIEKRISPRTKAIIVTHLFGNPCEMSDIMDIARHYEIPVIEDCAQSFLATYDHRKTGTIGAIGCFSLQQGKHITTGEGGVVVTNDDALARRLFLFINKAWGYGDTNPDHYFLALNYRLSELQGAVALAQLGKLEAVVNARVQAAKYLTRRIKDLPGIETPYVTTRSVHTYWKYCLRVDSSVIVGGAVGLAKLLKEKNIASAPRYIQKPAFRCQVFRDQVTFGKSRWPFTLAHPDAVNYEESRFPGTFAALEGVLVLPWNELYTETHLDYIANALQESVKKLTRAEVAVTY
jgi:dTDP-4-amino-4,6-dideoxygalactose transaminase